VFLLPSGLRARIQRSHARPGSQRMIDIPKVVALLLLLAFRFYLEFLKVPGEASVKVR
jgi:hypothetical protein